MNYPENLKYSKTHEWISFSDDGVARIGLTDYAQDALGSIVFINLPEEGDEVEAEVSLGEVESVKAVSDIICPVTGTVSAVNEEVLDAPELVNEAPYENWLIEVSDITEQEELLDAAAYEALCKKEQEEA